MMHASSRKKDGHGINEREAWGPQYYTHWEVSEDEEDENQVRSSVRNQNPHLTGHNSQFSSKHQSPRNGNLDVGSRSDRSIPRQKFNVEFDYEDPIETSSSGSFTSGYGRPSHTPQSQPSQLHKHQVRYYPQEQPRTTRQMSKGPHHGSRMSDIPEKFRDEKDGSEIYVVDTAYMKPPASVYSHYSGKSRAPSEMSSVKTKTSRKGGVVVETMSAPNPCCPNTKGVCWLLVLINLGLILVTLGFSIVLQLFDPPFVWYFGIAFLIVGFTALFASLIFCLHLCRESESQRRRGLQPGEMYWTHHWQKRIALPGMTRHETEKADDVSTVYSARNEPDILHYPREDRRDMTPIHTYNHH
ncbi:unnamed protein product [Allacma fusca]|uniref:Uncharacterized protein n=1 Tax=Allacma fusca TaxID=39272 RepID=A0A8J2KMJ0_9HEXA|nr:unnamed protein product [Allacma fusca]